MLLSIKSIYIKGKLNDIILPKCQVFFWGDTDKERSNLGAVVYLLTL